ncbi:HD-GYP domain-containing protein [Treponema sp.]|uniref:HD-GYP domain-containing protein n=1 Tax=Treponema sp. TaxID=166 RepID=UPI003EFF29AD
MPIEDEEFFAENIENVNRLTTGILLLGNVLAPLFIIISRIGIFEIPYSYSISLGIIIVLFSIIQSIFVYVFRWHRIPMFFGLFVMAAILAYMGTNGHIGINISYVLVVFLSCLYYNVVLTRFIALVCYVFMIFSIYFRAKVMCVNFGTTESFYFFSQSAGFTIEFAFSYIIAVSLSKRSHSTLSRALKKAFQLKDTQMKIMEFIPIILESHELFTGHHVRHTVKYVELISRELVKEGHYKDILTDNIISVYSAAANLHDIGKVHIPDSILNKPGKYTYEEFQMMKSHPEEGRRLIRLLPMINRGLFNMIAEQMAYCHHEKYDGSGYPNGLSGIEIPLCARIMAAADVLDALLSWRPYKQPFSIERTIEIFKESRGSHFEPCIVDAVINIASDIERISNEFQRQEIEDERKEYDWRVQLDEGREKSR